MNNDPALLLSAILAGGARWAPFHGQREQGEVCVGGLRYSTRLDEDGCPILTEMMRARLREALERIKSGDTPLRPDLPKALGHAVQAMRRAVEAYDHGDETGGTTS